MASNRRNKDFFHHRIGLLYLILPFFGRRILDLLASHNLCDLPNNPRC